MVNEATFVEWLQRLQASAYLFSLGGASVHAPVTAMAMRVRACVRTICNAAVAEGETPRLLSERHRCY